MSKTIKLADKKIRPVQILTGTVTMDAFEGLLPDEASIRTFYTSCSGLTAKANAALAIPKDVLRLTREPNINIFQPTRLKELRLKDLPVWSGVVVELQMDDRRLLPFKRITHRPQHHMSDVGYFDAYALKIRHYDAGMKDMLSPIGLELIAIAPPEWAAMPASLEDRSMVEDAIEQIGLYMVAIDNTRCLNYLRAELARALWAIHGTREERDSYPYHRHGVPVQPDQADKFLMEVSSVSATCKMPDGTSNMTKVSVVTDGKQELVRVERTDQPHPSLHAFTRTSEVRAMIEHVGAAAIPQVWECWVATQGAGSNFNIQTIAEWFCQEASVYLAEDEDTEAVEASLE